MKISDDGMPQPSAKNAFGFAHLLSAHGDANVLAASAAF
jgi:hypothetical protein